MYNPVTALVAAIVLSAGVDENPIIRVGDNLAQYIIGRNGTDSSSAIGIFGRILEYLTQPGPFKIIVVAVIVAVLVDECQGLIIPLVIKRDLISQLVVRRNVIFVSPCILIRIGNGSFRRTADSKRIGSAVRYQIDFVDYIHPLGGHNGRLFGKPLVHFLKSRFIIGIVRSAIPDVTGQFVHITLEFVCIVLCHGKPAVFVGTGVESDQLDVDSHSSLRCLTGNRINQVIQRFQRRGETCIAVVETGIHGIGYIEHQRQIISDGILDTINMSLVTDNDVRTGSSRNGIGMNTSFLRAHGFQMNRVRHDVTVTVGHGNRYVVSLTLRTELGVNDVTVLFIDDFA